MRSHAERGNEGSLFPSSTRQTLVEIALIFAVFCLQGAWPVPDVNEPCYLGKAIHYWNPDWLRGDFFMESADTHGVFYFTFGWLSLWLAPTTLVWTGRILTWLLLAWSWRRLSAAVIPRPWWSVLTATLFGCLMERCHMAGEWVIGGVEAKGFAYVLVFLALESLVRNRWNRALLMLGAASAFHVLVGGWSAVAVGLAWLWLKKPRPVVARGSATTGRGFVSGQSPLPRLRSIWPGIVGGGLLALPGLIPVLLLDWGIDRETLRQARQIYVFERLPHHLILTGMRWDFVLRFALLWLFWLALGKCSRHTTCAGADGTRSVPATVLLRAFVAGAMLIAWIGAAINPLMYVDGPLAADLLRFYWFRLSDVALPLGVALEGTALIVGGLAGRADKNVCPTRWRCCWLALAVVVAGFQVGNHAIDRLSPGPLRSNRIVDYVAWREACDWVVQSGQIPLDAKFLTPRLSSTFKWYTGRTDVANWKDVPQDAQEILEWWRRIEAIYMTGKPSPPRWHESLATLGAARLKALGARYNAGYAITQAAQMPPDLPEVYRNRTYVIYRLR